MWWKVRFASFFFFIKYNSFVCVFALTALSKPCLPWDFFSWHKTTQTTWAAEKHVNVKSMKWQK